jgi:methyl-accepting chemotaxis protein
MKKSKSISFKLVMSALLIVTVLVVIFGIYDYRMQSERLELKQQAQLTLIESRLKLNLPAVVWNYEQDQMVRVLNSEQQSADVTFLQLLNDNNEVIAQSEGEATDHFISVKLTYVEGDEINSVGSVNIFIDSSDIEAELSALAMRTTVKAILLALFLVISLTILFNKLVTQPLTQVANALENIARGEGDLTQRLTVKRDDEIGRVADSFNVFVSKIQSLVQSIQGSVEQTFVVAKNVHNAADACHGHLQNQQMETDQVAAAITQMSSSAKEIAGNVQLTADAADQASQNAKQVSRIVQESIDSIAGLSTQLNQAASVVNSLENDVGGIVSVLDVIRAIAEQTNLLALNAAIEAARAGDQGRGFAVVADEVRALASRTQESTAQIQATIQKLQAGSKSAVKVMEDSQAKSSESVANAQSSGVSIASILQSTDQITAMASQIATAVEEQSAVAEELSHNVNRIVTAGHESMQQIENMADNSKEMQANAETLSAFAQQFKA